MEQDKKIDTFKPYDATQISFLNRGKGINAPDVQAAIEEVYDRVSEGDHLHRGRGENSVRLGPGSSADAESSVAIGDSAYTAGDQAVGSVALGARSGAHGERSVAIGDGANSFVENGIAIGASATNHDNNEDARDAISIGTNAYARNQAVGIGASAQAIGSHSLAIGVESQSTRNNTVSIGRETQANADDSVAIGYKASANTPKTVAIGYNSQSNGPSGIALGDSAEANAEASIAIGKETVTWGGGNVALGKSAIAVAENAVAIGSGASAQAPNAVAIGPGAIANEDNTIVLGTPEHKVVVPGNLTVQGMVTGSVTWIGPSDNIIAEIQNPIIAERGTVGSSVQKQLTLKNPGRYRIKGVLTVEKGTSASLTIWENEEQITDPISTTGQRSFSVDFNRDIGINTTLTVSLVVVPGPGSGGELEARASVSQIRICGTATDIGTGVVTDW